MSRKIDPSLSCRHAALCIIAILIFIPVIGGDGRAGERNTPFQQGEKMTYRALWGGIPAGDVVIEVLPMETIGGMKCYHFAMTTKTNAPLDLVYKIRERQDSYVDIGMTRSLLYTKRTEGEHPRDVIVNFNWEKREATRSNFGEKMAPVSIIAGSFDPLALFFVIRLHELRENGVLQIPITEGDNNVVIKATIVQREVIEIEGKMYDTFAVIPDMEQLERQKVVKKSDRPLLKIWFTADDKKIPVKIQSRVGVGYFIFELVSANLGER